MDNQRIHAIRTMALRGPAPRCDIGFDHGALLDAEISYGVEIRKHLVQALAPNRRVLRCCVADGLSAYAANSMGTIVATGLGEQRLRAIATDAQRVLRPRGVLVLGPHGGAADLRRSLAAQWQVIAEDLVCVRGRFHPIICYQMGAEACADPVSLLLGPQLVQTQHPLLPAYIAEQWQRLANQPAAASAHAALAGSAMAGFKWALATYKANQAS